MKIVIGFLQSLKSLCLGLALVRALAGSERATRLRVGVAPPRLIIRPRAAEVSGCNSVTSPYPHVGAEYFR